MRYRISTVAAIALAATALLGAGAGSAQATPVFHLRVEAVGSTLDPGTYYATPSSVRAPRGRLSGESSQTCIGAPGRHEVDGGTALGLVASASLATASLRPLLVAEDAFGRRVCRIGDAIERDTPSFSGWLFKYNHAAPPLSSELVTLSRGSEVLWVFADFGTFANSGDELVLTAPVRAQPGVVQVSVQAITFDGTVGPAPDGTVVSGGTAPVLTSGGVAAVPVQEGETALRAVGPGATPTEIPSAPQSLCVAADVESCPVERGRRIIGSNARDGLKGAGGPDRIKSRGGPDKVRVKGGDADVVNCGKGRDLVIADRSDRLRRCDRVLGPAGKGDGESGKRKGGGRRG